MGGVIFLEVQVIKGGMGREATEYMAILGLYWSFGLEGPGVPLAARPSIDFRSLERGPSVAGLRQDTGEQGSRRAGNRPRSRSEAGMRSMPTT
jgi:hypothetical protein